MEEQEATYLEQLNVEDEPEGEWVYIPISHADILAHYGTPRHSGRYPYGSGKQAYQHSGDFYSRVEALRKNKDFTFTDANGKTWTGDNAIAKSMGLTSTQFRVQYANAKDERRILNVNTATRLRDKEGLSPTEIGRRMGVNESTVRSWFNEESAARMTAAKTTADYLKKEVDAKGIVDIGKGVELQCNVSRQKFDEAVYMLELQGYNKYGRSMAQVTNPGNQTIMQVLAKPGVTHKDIYNMPIESVGDYISHDGGLTFDKKFEYPASMDSKRLQIRYAEDGGVERDGLVELRRGCADLDLGNSNYSQVRILVDGTHYIKGMAVYADNLPPGVDVRFNTNKDKSKSKMEVLKPIKADPDNPFGSAIKDKDLGGQYYYTDKDGKKKLGLINKRSDEGDWNEWADKLPSQFLGKQNLDLINRQIKISKDDKAAEFADICALTNPTVKKALLTKYADSCDKAAVDLKLASLPRQKYKVLLPVPSLKDTEVYAPTYENGEKVALVRYPHGGTFEIPILTVNNRNAEARKMFGNGLDAIGINKNVADRLSGADFDGDTATVIPTAGNGKNLGVRISSRDELRGLKGFDPKMAYPARPGMKVMKNTNMEMGKISNLITDMTIKGADDSELAAAVRHSMVVIDAEKHHLDYKKSEVDNNISALKKKYQTYVDSDGVVHTGGASTLMSRAKSPANILKRKGSPHTDPVTGEKVYKQVREEYVDKNGKTQIRTTKSTKMAEAKDARALSSGSIKEEAYAEYANTMKAYANKARLEVLKTGKIEFNKEAKLKYDAEVKSLDSKLRIAKSNAPKERQAQVLANAAIKAKRDLYLDSEKSPSEIKKELKKVSQQELTKARNIVGAHKKNIEITDKEWEAIQSGAISESKLKEIIDNADIDVLRQRAMPKTTNSISDYKINRIKAYDSYGYTIQEIANQMGVSTSTVCKYIKG